MRLYLFGMIVAFLILFFFLFRYWITQKNEERKVEELKKLKESVEKEKNETLEKINSGDNKSDFDNSINILHDYSNRRK